MTEKRLDRLEDSMSAMNENMSKFLIANSAHVESLNHFIEEVTELKEQAKEDRELFNTFITKYIEEDKPVINTSRYLQNQGKKGLTWLAGVFILSLLLLGGKPLFDKYDNSSPSSTTSTKKTTP